MAHFMFSTGIENSYPTIQNGRKRVDEMAKCKHYECWQEDFSLVEDLGISYLRYGPPLHKTFLGPIALIGSSPIAFNDLKAAQSDPDRRFAISGVPDWIGNFQNPDFPKLFASYAKAFAERFPWVQLYTSVNEMYICATFSALRVVERRALDDGALSLR